MIDFHSHFLPGIDDGASSLSESEEILLDSAAQGIQYIFATPHFYPDREDPSAFLARRSKSFDELRKYISAGRGGRNFPKVFLGAEVYYFPGLSDAEEIEKLKMGPYALVLIEPPMSPWTEYMLDDIESLRSKRHLCPIIAHVDRYAHFFDDYSIFDELYERKILIQVNANFFLRSNTSQKAMDLLEDGIIHFIGSDVHNTNSRPQNIGDAVKKIYSENHLNSLAFLEKRMYNLLSLK